MDYISLKKILKPADILLIVPPFLLQDQQSLAVHILKAMAEKSGMCTQIFYANLHFASLIGKDYDSLCNINFFFPGERIFSRAAYGEDRMSIHADMYHPDSVWGKEKAASIGTSLYFFPPVESPGIERLREIENLAYNWVLMAAEVICEKGYGIVGCTSNMEQTNAGIALLKSVKERKPGTVAMIGGFNCQGELAGGIASLDPGRKIIDYIFSGESEKVFADFLEGFKKGSMEKERIIKGSPYMDLDDLPEIDYSPYIEQLYAFLPSSRDKEKAFTICYETSRGCWWGQKQKCLFCGHDSERMHHRYKSASRVVQDMRRLKKYKMKFLQTTDLIMPRRYFHTLLPRLGDIEDMPDIYYEQKLPLGFAQLKLLKKAGVTLLQPGLETFIDPLLADMKKGITARQNILFLRYALSLDITPLWNFIWGFPGEKSVYYEQMVSRLPLLFHLHPPVAVFHLGIARFSRYYTHYKEYGINGITPLHSYREIYPGNADIENLALMFIGDYDAETYRDHKVIDALIDVVREWNGRWSSFLTRPRLWIEKGPRGRYMLYDTRKLPGTELSYRITEEQGKAVLLDQPYRGTDEQEWALSIKAALLLHRNTYIPLATGTPRVLDDFGAE